MKPTHSVSRVHAVYANAWCDSALCQWLVEDTGSEGVKRVRAAARRHVMETQHEVALDVTSLDRYTPADG